MLKWLSGARPKGPQPAEVVTDDPLATIHVAAAGKLDGPLEIYAVSRQLACLRVNPIFDEGGGPADRRGGGRCDRGGSSGYGSSGSGGGSGGGSGARSPCNSSSGGDSPKQSAPPTPEQASPTRTSATTPSGRCAALQSRSPLPARQPRPPVASPPPPPPDTPAPPPPPPAPGGSASSSSSCPRLCPIPEGRPVAVPRPVWPPAHLEALYAALSKHSAHALVPAAAAAAARDHASDTASSSASSGFGDDHPPSLSTRLVRGERCSSTSMSSSREKLLTARSSDAGAGVGVNSVCRAQAQPQSQAQHAAPQGKRPGVATAAAVAAGGHWTGVTPGDVCLQSKDGLLWKPDFTLDKAAAERLMRNIQKAKRRRCVCHAATSFLGLAVFLLSVMLVSLAMTGGRRYFGSL